MKTEFILSRKGLTGREGRPKRKKDHVDGDITGELQEADQFHRGLKSLYRFLSLLVKSIGQVSEANPQEQGIIVLSPACSIPTNAVQSSSTAPLW